MNPEDLLSDVAEMIEAAKRQGFTHCHICCYLGKLQVCERHHTEALHAVFFLLNDRHMRDGLTPQEWNHLQTKLVNYYAEIEAG